ncbi:zinc-ribbon domain containing protein [Patescibacteria group bacterium]|nr:zinc-ribbon domain containing protein [Patescibacteria group bacterium]MBU4017272.1 zinc-ribbon domain containing protein [Patescibacteria group bacterium]
MAEVKDITLTCKDCGQNFVWTADEQEFYKQKNFSAPLRCKNCRVKARAKFDSGNGGSRQSFPITCGQCGAQDTVPFQPRGDRPVLCRNCFKKGDR